MQIKECMTGKVELAHPGMSLREVAQKMQQGDYGCLPVEESDRLVGMVTDRDIVLRALPTGTDDPREMKVREVMSESVYYCFEDEDVEDVVENMGNNQIRRLPVLNREKRLVGIVSLGDLALKKVRRIDDALNGISRHSPKDSTVHIRV